MTDDTLEAIYSPETGRVACVLLQAAFGTSQKVSRMFPADDWDTAPRDTMRRMSATAEQWKLIAAMPREARVARWKDRGGQS
jgi:hypothetical protein